MKKTILLFLMNSCFLFLTSQNRNESRLENPPGTIYLNDSLYIDNTPVTNLMYLEFLNNIKSFWLPEKSDSIRRSKHRDIDKKPILRLTNSIGSSRRENLTDMNFNELFLGVRNSHVDFFLKMLINSNSIIEKNVTSKDYLVHPKYRKFPVLRLNKLQAEMYCKWRTDLVMLLYSTKHKTKEERNKYYSKVNYRLASYAEFKYAESIFNGKKASIKTKEKSPLKLTPRNSSKKLIFNHISEMTLDDQLYGNNWSGIYDHTPPNNYTGFRCICEVEK
ncbi:hypothetical protein D7030_01745 [Flavobacteriaceae bacterium AU392]|nr:hypothetical protein D1817_08220 [Flavobacteriaceae bacterium]RKM85419.1 hypothetical protein D7030_01745 [Flavobacteriaceae bacterium AU392]